MSDLLRLEPGAAPWRPAPDVELVEELHRYDIPLVGILEQHATRYVFACFIGEVEPVNVWLYAHISKDEARELGEAVASNFAEALHKALTDRLVQVCVAFDWKIADWATVDAGQEPSQVTAARGLHVLQRKWKTVGERQADLPRPQLSPC